MFQTNRLTVLVWLLSFIVLAEAVFLLQTLNKRPVQPSISQEKIKFNTTSLIVSADEVATPSAKITLEEIPYSDGISIWLEATASVQTVDVTLQYPANIVTIIDSIPENEGIQIELGAAEHYLDNSVDTAKGVVRLVARFKSGFTGKIRLGTVWFTRQSNKEISFNVLYVPQSQLGSYVTDINGQGNLLAKPENLVVEGR